MSSSDPPALERLDDGRLTVEVFYRPSQGKSLARDVRLGLSARQKALPPKYFYDDRGSRLFDRICDTPEYYPTRTELALLDRIADTLIDAARPTDLVELGSGAARKTRRLLDAMGRSGRPGRYVPFDVSESMLVDSSRQLLHDYPWLTIHGVVGDYEEHLDRIPRGERRLILFIGSTLGNFAPNEAVRFLSRIREQMKENDRLLLGTDLVKNRAVLDAAYNDAQGLTAAFNKNVLSVINRELHADFEPDSFEHVAFFEPEKNQVEMYLRSRRRQEVHIRALDMSVHFEEGETIHTEVSRKFTRASLSRTLERAGLQLSEWYTPENEYFALSLSRKSSLA